MMAERERAELLTRYFGDELQRDEEGVVLAGGFADGRQLSGGWEARVGGGYTVRGYPIGDGKNEDPVEPELALVPGRRQGWDVQAGGKTIPVASFADAVAVARGAVAFGGVYAVRAADYPWAG